MSDACIANPCMLIPSTWLRADDLPSLRTYNPSIVIFRGRLLMAYRIDSGRRRSTQRRIGLCELDAHLNVVSGSVVPLSDTICGGDPRHYDPRFLVYRDRLFVHYNNNFQTRPNQIHLVELDPDTLQAKSAARQVLLSGPRQDIEKNWMFYDHDGDLYAVYTIAPHVVLRADPSGAGPVMGRRVFRSEWDVSAYATRYGTPCGGAPPVRQGDVYISFFHSRWLVSRLRWVLRFWPVAPGARLPRYLAAIERRLRRPFGQVRYGAGVYVFEATPPFRPVWLHPAPVLRPEDQPPRERRPRANPFADGIVYPCGAIPWHHRSWLVSYGLHDERCCLGIVYVPWLSGSPTRQEVETGNG